MTRHLVCLTIDTDPDGLSGVRPNRQALCWKGLMEIRGLPEELESHRSVLGGRRVPITWFIRMDGQLRGAFGDSLHLVWEHEDFWRTVQGAGDELAWHPHLYRQSRADQEPEILSDPVEAVEELHRLWEDVAGAFFAPTAFRNGEGWHCAATYSAVESFGLVCDSTAIPGRYGPSGHPMNWQGAPNQPYFPDQADLRRPGPTRPLLEVPLTTWRVRAPYDRQPQLRYINPAIHEELFATALDDWERIADASGSGLMVWTLILHPDDAMPGPEDDMLYARSRAAVLGNLKAFVDRAHRRGDTCEFTALSQAAMQWRQYGKEQT